MSKEAAVYSWESLEIYGQTNQFARLLGRLIAALPDRLHVQVHQLIALTITMSNAIAGAHVDVLPGGDSPSSEQRFAYLMIGQTAAHTATRLLGELARASKRPEIAEGLRLLDLIAAGFRQDIEKSDAAPKPDHVHLA
jgi:hypothetical protein